RGRAAVGPERIHGLTRSRRVADLPRGTVVRRRAVADGDDDVRRAQAIEALLIEPSCPMATAAGHDVTLRQEHAISELLQAASQRRVELTLGGREQRSREIDAPAQTISSSHDVCSPNRPIEKAGRARYTPRRPG